MLEKADESVSLIGYKNDWDPNAAYADPVVEPLVEDFYALF